MTSRSIAVVILSLTVASCGSTEPESFIDISGRLERSATVTLSASFNGMVLPDSEVDWTAEPLTAVAFGDSGTAVLVETGAVTLVARASRRTVTRDIDIAVPPTIVFDLLRDGNRDIYRVALDGQDTMRLTADFGEDGDPTAAGNTVVFVSFRDGNGELYRTQLAGGTPERLTSTDEPEGTPALSRDGASLAHTRHVAGVFKLWVRSMESGIAARVTDSLGFPGSIETSPTWSPSGDSTVFVSTHAGTADLFTYTSLDSTFAPLGSNSLSSADVEPAWSADGEWVAFASDRTGDTEIYAYELASGDLVRLTDRPGPDGRPAWLDDGRLVYVEWTGGNARLRWLDPAYPGVSHDIDIGLGDPDNPTGVAGEG